MNDREIDTVHHKIVSSLKVAAWERAKGELRTLSALDGSKSSPPRKDGRYTFEVIYEKINAFIADIEGGEWHI